MRGQPFPSIPGHKTHSARCSGHTLAGSRQPKVSFREDYLQMFDGGHN